MSKIGIVVPVLNQFQLAIEAVESIRTSHEVIVCPILNYKISLPLSGAWNLGTYKSIQAGCDFILIINDDILFSPWTIDALVNCFNESSDDIVMVTASNVRGNINEPRDIYTWVKPDHNVLGENPDFACFMIRPSTIDLVGNFDENFSPAYFEDNDYHRRINLSGHKAISTSSAPYFHYGSQTQNADPNVPVVPPFAFEVNRNYYKNKWGGDPGEETFEVPFNNSELTFKNW